MRDSIVPATIVIDKPQCGFTSTKSSIAQIVDEEYFGLSLDDEQPERPEYTTDLEIAEDRLEQAVHGTTCLCDGDAWCYRTQEAEPESFKDSDCGGYPDNRRVVVNGGEAHRVTPERARCMNIIYRLRAER
jgi:hypothetical protein